MGPRNRWPLLLGLAFACGGPSPGPGNDLLERDGVGGREDEDFREDGAVDLPGERVDGPDVGLRDLAPEFQEADLAEVAPEVDPAEDLPVEDFGDTRVTDDAPPWDRDEDPLEDPGTDAPDLRDLTPPDLESPDPGLGDPGGEAWEGDPGGVDPGGVDPGGVDPGGVDPGAVDGRDPGSGQTACEGPLPGPYLDRAWASGPRPNTWSWNGSWQPSARDFPLAGLYDEEYFDGHRVGGRPTPILPPGRWDWNDADNDLANWRNFYTNLGEFLSLRDGCDRPFGWRFVPKYPEAVDFSGPGMYFEGSSGTDLLFLGPEGNLSSIVGSLGGGPDVLVFGRAWSLDYRTGATGDPGWDRDEDLVVAGCHRDAGLDYPIRTMTIHTGPGADVLFARNIRAAALDAGNGLGGRTDALDSTDGDDWIILSGNVKDVRVFGGIGDDVLAWYVDQMLEPTPYQGGDYFGGGGYGDAVFGDPGTDRLVLVVPPDTRIVDRPSSPPQPGTLLVMRENSGSDEPWYDEPTLHDPYARYCITCGRGPNGERTLFLQYASADGRIDTGYVSVTSFEELQVGVGAQARLYRLDQMAGRAVLAPDLQPVEVPEHPFAWCDLR